MFEKLKAVFYYLCFRRPQITWKPKLESSTHWRMAKLKAKVKGNKKMKVRKTITDAELHWREECRLKLVSVVMIFIVVLFAVIAYYRTKMDMRKAEINRAWMSELDSRGLITRNRTGSFSWNSHLKENNCKKRMSSIIHTVKEK